MTYRFPDIRIVGEGSQTQSREDQALNQALSMLPDGMSTYQRPSLPEPNETGSIDVGLSVLAEIEAELCTTDTGAGTRRRLDPLPATDQRFVLQVLGEGEVSITCEATAGQPCRYLAQESALAGIWLVQSGHPDQPAKYWIETGSLPEFVSQLSFSEAVPADKLDFSAALSTRDNAVQNAPSLLVELQTQLQNRQPDSPPHVLNLTLLPMTDADLILLGETLGVGPVTILSRGYGNCRIGSTAVENTWWVKYFNSQDGLIMNTIELTGVPPAAMAANEDIVDSAARLAEILEIYRADT